MSFTARFKVTELRFAAFGAGLGAVVLAGFYVCTSLSGMGAYAAAMSLMPALMATLFYQWARLRQHGAQEAIAIGVDAEQRLLRDPLTGLHSRCALELVLGQSGSLPDEEAGQGALLVLDLDHFRYVNETLGLPAGDTVLASLGRRLEAALSGAADVYRMCGDAFAIHVPGVPSLGKVLDIATLTKDLLKEPFDVCGAQFWLCGSIGIAFGEAGDPNRRALLHRADVALDRAKESAGNSHAVYTPDMAAEAHSRNALDHDLSHALQAGDFFLEYQPIVGLESGAIRSFEALIRWRHPSRGVVPPADFIFAAEKSGLILPLGNWVLQTACREAARWPEAIGIAVNVAGDQFKDPTFVSHVKTSLAEAGLHPARLTIEVTESIFSVDAQTIIDSLMDLRSYGVRIALDDFGMGFSSINNLRRFPLDQLKIDRSFTSAMLNTLRDAELMDIVLRLGTIFNVSTTIEGIETERQLEFVKMRGATQAQGFLISQPVSAAEALTILKDPVPRGGLRSPQQNGLLDR